MKRQYSATLFAILATCSCGPPAIAEGKSEFLFFASVDNLERWSIDVPDLQSSDLTPTLDILYSYNNGPWRILGEYFITDDEAEVVAAIDTAPPWTRNAIEFASI